MNRIVVVTVVMASFSAAFAGKTALEVTPGPTQLSAEERALQPDPAHGVEHAIILLEETDRNEDVGVVATIQHYHMRAKVLSSEGRDIANVTIPFKRSEIRKWWGKVLLPDGQVLDLPITRLDEQSLIESKGRRLASTTKAVLPGVVPGAVIDYGYEARTALSFGNPPIDLQRLYPIKQFRYRWEPRSDIPASAAFAVSNAAKRLPLRAVNESGAVLIEGDNLPPVVEEEHSPPDWEIRGKLLLYYYLDSEKDTDSYWKVNGKTLDRSVKAWIRKKSVWDKALTQIPLPEGGDLMSKLRAVYSWLEANIKNTSLSSIEEEELAESSDETQAHDPAALLQQREASSFELSQLFIGFARHLGAESNLVLAVDRRSQYWIREYRTLEQFSGFLASVRNPGEPVEKSIIVAPGYGLPWGESPWFFTAVAGLEVTAEGATPVLVPAAPPERNRSETKVKLTFSSEDQALHSVWTRRGWGQAGFRERRYLRSLVPEERESRLAELCGDSGRTEVTKHEAPSLDDLAGAFELSCEADTSDTIPGAQIGTFHFSWLGAWIDATPGLTETRRVHPVIFDYPRADAVEIDVEAPPGFKPETAPEDALIASKFGRYDRSITATESGFVIKRTLVLTAVIVNTDAYPDLLGFLRQVRKADEEPVVFKRRVSGVN